MGLFLIFTHPTNLGIRHSPEYITTAKGGGFLSQIKMPPQKMRWHSDIDKQFISLKAIQVSVGQNNKPR
jgi:hypothetical protein